MIHYTQCPVCNSTSVEPALTAKDHTVSGEMFAIWNCNGCTFRFTQDVPSQDAIGKYYQSSAYISHSDTREGIVNKLYHWARAITLSGKRNLVRRETGIHAGSLLDVGCGTGAFLHVMKQGGWRITGLEPDEAARANARSLHNIDAKPSHELFNLAHNSYDAITMWHVLEHVHQLQEYVEQMKWLLKENGVLFVAVPNYRSYDAGVYRENWAAYDVPRHLYHFSPGSMRTLMSLHGLKVKKTLPMWFDSFYVSMLSEECKNKKGNMLKAFFQGAFSNLTALFNKEKCSSLIYVITKN